MSTGPRRKERVRGGLRLGWVLAVLGLIVGLQEAGLEVPRQGKAYITAADPEGGGKWRLKGAIYEQDFQRGRKGPLRRFAPGA